MPAPTLKAVSLIRFSAFDQAMLTQKFTSGTCDRVSESDGQPMLPKILAAFRDAWLLSSSGVEIPPVQINARDDDDDSALDFNRLRGLLFVFFGIRINSAGEFDAQNQIDYNDMLGNMINPLSFKKSAWTLIPAK